MNNTSYLLLLSWLLLFFFFSFAADHEINHNDIMCPEKEREALLKFKEGIQDDLCGLLSTWEDDDDNKNCCQWHGIQCSNRTGNVIKLDLPGVYKFNLEDRCLQAMRNGTNLRPQTIYDDDVIYSSFFRGFLMAGMHINDDEKLMWKNEDQSLIRSVLGLVRAIDVSNNKLEGEIPFEISLLTGLVTLNLSRNHLHGNVTAIGKLTSLNALDLSNNRFSGEIPTSLADLNSLGVLDLSNNHFSGKIPTGPQLQTFNASSYEGNPGLCGMPLPKCPWDQLPDNNPGNEDDINRQDKSGIDDFYLGLYISVVLGFIIGFWGVCGSLVLKRSWRITFFRFFGDMKDKLYVMVSANIARIRRRQ